jgi:hypothetical protein
MPAVRLFQVRSTERWNFACIIGQMKKESRYADPTQSLVTDARPLAASFAAKQWFDRRRYKAGGMGPQ